VETGEKRVVRTVLLVDDFGPQRRAWARELATIGVFEAATRKQARLLAQMETMDLVIVDLFLGGENGIDVVRDMKALDPAPYVVVVSGEMTVAYAMAAVRAGADDVLVKPVKVAELITRVEQGDYVPPDLENIQPPTLDDVEWEHISRVLLDTNENITQTAQRLGIYRQTLQRKLKKRGWIIE
jgi:two-component system response regulator RegA